MGLGLLLLGVRYEMLLMLQAVLVVVVVLLLLLLVVVPVLVAGVVGALLRMWVWRWMWMWMWTPVQNGLEVGRREAVLLSPSHPQHPHQRPLHFDLWSPYLHQRVHRLSRPLVPLQQRE